MDSNSHTPSTPRSLFVFAMLYGGMTVIAGVLAYKQFAIGPLIVESGILAFLLLVVISSAVSQLHGKVMADRMVLWGFLPLAASIALIGLVLVLPASPDMPLDNLAAFERVHAQTPRIMAAGPVAYGVSLLLNVWIFNKLRGRGGDSGGDFRLMARGAIASAISQAVDTLIFITLAFYGEFPIGGLLVGQAIAKIVLSFVLVPFLIVGAIALARRLDRPAGAIGR
ncbi:queuosine precursor transporter [Aurantiacibacter poecillastricola]|uniref:queuosine precursor transporter n=1 Tax=Aurantiacibacter poecillastricola TaxID=3064385 RepID=UPI002740220A|nr:queuosine precursor transporter [Aurantiacibacter sp. 219JJ12-13]MDP5263051.1 queuosine precursor transporter [Aurantiacibacter sp. 219JJ12-13]